MFWHITEDYEAGIVPEDFPGVLKINPVDTTGKQSFLHKDYRDFGENGNKAFEYFVKRLLSKIHPSRTKYKNEKDYCTKTFDQAFTVSDEAFALLVLDNELHIWNDHIQRKQNKDGANVAPHETGLRKKYVDLYKKSPSGWTKQGKAIYVTLKKQLSELRRQKQESTSRYMDKFWEEAGQRCNRYAVQQPKDTDDKADEWSRLYEQNYMAFTGSEKLLPTSSSNEEVPKVIGMMGI